MNRAVGLSAQLTLRNSGLSAGPKQGAGRSNHPSQELMIAEKYLKDLLRMAKQYSQCKNFQPVHDLDYCKYVGLGWTCNFEGDDER